MSFENCGCSGEVDDGSDNATRKTIRETYAAVASSASWIEDDRDLADSHAMRVGYSSSDLADLPHGANLGLGCGNPVRLASIRPGQVVLDLGAGAGIDCLIVAKKTGPEGMVIGVDTTSEMVVKARSNAAAVGVENVEFCLGEIEHLPIADSSVDLVISNCVINLSERKRQVFDEIRRVLKPGGRVAISDTATRMPVPAELREAISGQIGCGDNTLLVDEYASIVEDAGLRDVIVVDTGPAWLDRVDTESGCCGSSCSGAQSPKSGEIGLDDLMSYLTSVSVQAVK